MLKPFFLAAEEPYYELHAESMRLIEEIEAAK
jgi:hypothetical protein